VRKVKSYAVRKESFEDMIEAKRFNPCLEIIFRDKTGRHTHKISAGYSDDVSVYRENSETFVLSQNHSLGYVGLEAFMGSEKIGDIFLEEHQVKETIGRDDLAPFTIIRSLMDYL